MKFKTWFKKIRKKLDTSRPNEYYNALSRRYISVKMNALFKINEITSDLPSYVSEPYVSKIQKHRNYIHTNDFIALKENILTLRKNIELIFNDLLTAIKRIDTEFPKVRKRLNFRHVKFVKITNCHLKEIIGYVVHISNMGNKTDYRVYGRFFDKLGNLVEIDYIDKTYLIDVLNDENEFNRYLNLYSRYLKDKPLAAQQAELSLLNKNWEKQIIYLNQKENEERNM